MSTAGALIKTDVSAVQDLLRAHAEPNFWALLNGWDEYGIVEHDGESDRVVPGQKIENPITATVGALGPTNLKQRTACTPVAGPAQQRGRGPVISRALTSDTSGTANQPITWRLDAIRATLVNEPQFAERVAKDMARQAARAVKIAWYNACIGAILAQTSNVRHIKTNTTTPVYTDIMDSLTTMYERRNQIRLAIYHPNYFNYVEKDLLGAASAGYRTFEIGDMIVKESLGKWGNMLVLVDADRPRVAASGGKYTYYGLHFAMNAGRFTHAPNSPDISFIETPLTPGVRSVVAQVEVNTALNIPGMDFSGSVDSTSGTFTDAQLLDSTNWTEAYSFDHRDVGISAVTAVF